MKKKLSKQDNRLLDVLGFQETLKILADEEKNKQIKNELIDTQSGIGGGSLKASR